MPRLFAFLLRLYPLEFRARFGTAMRETFTEELAHERTRGRAAVLLLWLRVLVRTPVLALEERVRGGPGSSRPRGIMAPTPRRGIAVELESWVQDVRHAFRFAGRAPGFVLVAILTISLGIGATASLFSIINALLLRPLPVLEPDRLVRIQELRSRTLSSGMEGPRIPWDRVRAYDEAMGNVFSGMAAQNLRNLSMRADGPAFPTATVLASGNYFDVLGVRPAVGRFFTGDDEPAAVLGYRLWQRRFGGDPAVVGRTVHVSGYAFTVVGVAPDGFGGTLGFLFADVWVPHGAHGGAAWPDLRLSPFGRLRPGVERVAAETFASAVALRIPPDDDPGAELHGVALEPLTGTPAEMSGPVRQFLGLLLATAFLVLLIAAANVAGMLLARAVGRRREVAVRLALGSGRRRLVRQFMLESLVLFALGGIGGMLVATWFARVVSTVRLPVAEPVLIDAAPDLRVWFFGLVLAVGVGSLFGLLPAWQAARSDPAPALRDGGHGSSRRGAGARDVFVAAQLALSVLLLIVATLFVRTLQRTMALDPGFTSDHVVIATTNLAPHGYDAEGARAFHAQLIDRVRSQTTVEAAASANVALLTGETETFSAWRVTAEGPAMHAGQNIVDDAYLETMGFELVAGRAIDATDVAGAPAVVVINEAFARRAWPGENVVGKVVLRGDQPHEVVGVVRDGAYVEFGEELMPFTFLSTLQRHSSRQVLHVRHRPDTSPAEVITMIRAEVAALDADVAVANAMPLTTATEFLLFPQRFAAVLIGLFGVLGLVLGAIGVYGVLTHNVAQRAREFGIRIALGADARNLLGMVLRRGALLVGTGTVVGLLCAAALTRFLQGWLHGVSPLDASAFLGAPLVLGAVALLASTLPARRTLRVDPVEALRRE